MTIDLARYLKQRKALIEQALDRYLPRVSEPPEIVHEAMRYAAVDGGKRIRPILTLAACEAVGGRVETAVPAACAIECVHAFSLIHDDLPCMDDDDYRRGRPTLHRVFGEAIALLAADALFALAFQLTSEMRDVPKGSVIEATRILACAAGTRGMVGGQVMDMLAQDSSAELQQIERIHRLKTGALLEASAVIGGLLGGASEKQAAALSDYGRNIGLAFQIADDILDLKGDSAKLGKSTGSDVRLNKATYPSSIGIERSSEVATQAMQAAIAGLSGFDEKADPLRKIARFIVERDV